MRHSTTLGHRLVSTIKRFPQFIGFCPNRKVPLVVCQPQLTLLEETAKTKTIHNHIN